jgi:hypothetical protein
MQSAQPFYVVVKDDDQRYKRHPKEKDAIAEAKRLTEKEGSRFYVLKVVDAFQPLEKVERVDVGQLWGIVPNIAWTNPDRVEISLS